MPRSTSRAPRAGRPGRRTLPRRPHPAALSPDKGRVRSLRRRPREVLGPDSQAAQAAYNRRRPSDGPSGPARPRDRTWRPVAEQITALPFPGDPLPGQWLQPGAQIGLFNVSAYRYSVWHSGEASQCAEAGRSPPHSGCSPAAAPPSTVSPGGSGVRVQVQEDLLRQPRLLLGQPPLHRDRLGLSQLE